jgi:arsenite-transporting ATPase
MVTSVMSALSAGQSQLFMVTSPEEFSLNEAVRSADALADSVPDLKIGAMVLNRAVVGRSSCPVCASRAKMTAAAKKFIARNFSGLPLFVGEDVGNPILGAGALLKFGEHLFAGKKATASSAAPTADFPEIELTPWPEINSPLVFTMGKGGVGKTTVSATIGFRQRASDTRKAVTVCSTDPAPSLDDVFQQKVNSRPAPVLGDKRFHAIEVDSVAEFRQWASAMQEKISAAFSTQSGGLHVDLSFDRQIFSSLLNIVPPGVDEIFAIFKILDLLGAQTRDKIAESTVIIDMAPTGHALELLRMPERMLMWSRLLLKSLAPHRTLPLAQDVAVEIASLGQQMRELVKIMQDPARSCAFAVMLAEPMPDNETARLLNSLEDLQVSVQAVFVNRIVMMKDAGRCVRCNRARRWQAATLAGLKKRYRGKAKTIYLLPNMRQEIAGKEALRKFTGELWQLA